MSVGPAQFDLNRCNESPLRGEKPDFWPVSKNNTGSLPLLGNPAGNNTEGHALCEQDDQNWRYDELSHAHSKPAGMTWMLKEGRVLKGVVFATKFSRK